MFPMLQYRYRRTLVVGTGRNPVNDLGCVQKRKQFSVAKNSITSVSANDHGAQRRYYRSHLNFVGHFCADVSQMHIGDWPPGRAE